MSQLQQRLANPLSAAPAAGLGALLPSMSTQDALVAGGVALGGGILAFYIANKHPMLGAALGVAAGLAAMPVAGAVANATARTT